MASKFINVVSSAALAAGATIAVAHELNRDGVALTPHIYAASVGGFTVTVDATNVTFTNNTGAAATCTAYVRYDHSFQQVFGPAGTQTIAGLPFNIGGGGANVTLAQAYANGPAGGQVIPLDATRDGILLRYGAGILNDRMFAVQNAAGTVEFLAVYGGSPDGLAAISAQAHTTINPVAVTGVEYVQLPTFRVIGPADDTLSASTENTQIELNLGQTRTWLAGSFALQRTMRIAAETIAFAGASTVTNAATLWISGAPTAGVNATLTNSWALLVADGDVAFDGNALWAGDRHLSVVYNAANEVTVEAFGETGFIGYSLVIRGSSASAGSIRTGGPLTIIAGRGSDAAGVTPSAGGGITTIHGGGGGAGSGLAAASDGGQLQLFGGGAGTDNGGGGADGGAIYVNGGTGTGAGVSGQVFIGTVNDGDIYLGTGLSRLTFYAGAPVTQRVGPTVDITNNVTAGGVNGTIADYADLAVYAVDAATIRNNFYQLARGLKFVSDALRAYNLIT